MYKIAAENLQALFQKIAADQDLYLPVKVSDQVNFKAWSEDAEVCLDTLKTAQTKQAQQPDGSKVSIKQIFPFFILFFIAASIITTLAVNSGISESVFKPIKELSKFFIVMAMSAIGLNTNIVKLIKTGGKPLLLGFCCWVSITIVSLLVQYYLGLW